MMVTLPEKKKPTIAELEAMLDDPRKLKVSIQPDGSVTAVPDKAPDVKDLLIENRHLKDELAKLKGHLKRIRRIVDDPDARV